MKEVFLLLLTAGFSFLLCLCAAVGGLLKKSSRLLTLAAIAFMACGGLASWAGYSAFHKAKSKIAAKLKPRTGNEIYVGLFGEESTDCTQIIESQDQVVPRIDIAIWLHFKTCPQEFRRLLSRHQFSRSLEETAHWQEVIPGAEGDKWFRPQAMGDTIVVYEYATAKGRNIQTFWASRDSTEVFYRDIVD